MAVNELYAVTETYIALVVYYVLHMIYVIAGDFIEAFSIPPLNIGIYIDKLASIRALMMTVADIIEYLIAQYALNDNGNGNTSKGGQGKLFDKDGHRRHGSVVSLLAMLVCRIAYLWLVYNSNNKSLSAFVTLCVEGFWFGYFQMSFFAIGPEYNAFTSFALHLTGNLVFFFQIILTKLAESRPTINSLSRVRVHAWIALAVNVIAIPYWLIFTGFYIKGLAVPDGKKGRDAVSAGGTATTEAGKVKTALDGGTDTEAASYGTGVVTVLLG